MKFKIQPKLFQHGQTISEFLQENACAAFLQALHSLLAWPFTHKKSPLTSLQELLQIKFSRQLWL